MQITRGDTKRYRFKRYDMNGNVITNVADSVHFTVKKTPCCKVVLQKSLGKGITYDEETNYYYIDINPEDTENLDFDTYGFDIEIIAGDIVTTVCVGKIVIGVEYTNRRDRK